MKLARGTVVLLDLTPAVGHEQGRRRPCVVVSDPAVTTDQKYPLVCIVPITGTPGEGALYPALGAGKSGLSKASYALVDQVRSVDKVRISRTYGQVTPRELAAIDSGLGLFLGLGGPSAPEAERD